VARGFEWTVGFAADQPDWLIAEGAVAKISVLIRSSLDFASAGV